MKINAIFSDYDGTICPLESPRAQAFIPERLQRVLVSISSQIPIGIITTKDFDFIEDKVPFAKGVATVAGLELHVDGRRVIDPAVKSIPKALEKTYREVVAEVLQIGDDVVVERKTVGDDELVAFCIDWRLSKNKQEARKKVEPLLAICRKAGLDVTESEVSPFANVFPIQLDKGKAFVKLRDEMHVTPAVLYLGDSEMDDPAFKMADVSVGVKHTRVMPKLACKYRVEFVELEVFLAKLLDAGMDFSEEMIEPNQ